MVWIWRPVGLLVRFTACTRGGEAGATGAADPNGAGGDGGEACCFSCSPRFPGGRSAGCGRANRSNRAWILTGGGDPLGGVEYGASRTSRSLAWWVQRPEDRPSRREGLFGKRRRDTAVHECVKKGIRCHTELGNRIMAIPHLDETETTRALTSNQRG